MEPNSIYPKTTYFIGVQNPTARVNKPKRIMQIATHESTQRTMNANTPQTTFGSKDDPQKGPAFSLIELLVLVAVPAILTALIVPAMARSSHSGARTVCINNLRQMGTALNLYAAENQDYLAWPNWGVDSSPPCPRGWLYQGAPSTSPATTAHGGPAAVSNWSSRQLVHLKQAVYWQYVLNGNAFVCPNDLKPSLTGLWSQRENTLSTYVMNGAACYYAEPDSQYSYATPKLSQVWSPSCYIMWEPDQNSNVGCYFEGADFPGLDSRVGIGEVSAFGHLHVPGVNMLTVGGSVMVLSSADILAAQNQPGPGLLWWNPRTADGR
jgi:type II secretory pathway pseudopilin PulG